MIFGEAPQNRTADWQPSPTTRGTYQILASCLITLGLCIWTAVHLDIPEEDISPPRTKWDPRGWVSKQQWLKVGWLMMGLLAPEMVAYQAWHQRLEAHQLTPEMQKFLTARSSRKEVEDVEQRESSSQDGNGNPASDRINEWTHTHSFYALMGGFAFSTADLPEDKKFLPARRDRLMLTKKGLLLLAEFEPHHIPDISIEDITDKSKASGLDKTIVCVQATWFIAQTISRLASNLPISLLELSTAAHALCALLIFISWWDKPMNIARPTLIMGKQTHRTCATFYFYSKVFFSGWPKPTLIRNDNGIEPKPTLLLPHQRTFDRNAPLDYQLADSENSVGKLYVNQSIAGFALKYGFRDSKPDSFHTTGHVLSTSRAYIKYTRRDVRCLALAYDGIDQWEKFLGRGLDERMQRSSAYSSAWSPTKGSLNYLTSTNLWDGYQPPETSVIIAAISSGVIYGGLHLLAWRAPFKSDRQQTIWQASAIIVVGAIPSLGLLGVFISSYRKLLKRYLNSATILARDPEHRLAKRWAWGLLGNSTLTADEENGLWFRVGVPVKSLVYLSRFAWVIVMMLTILYVAARVYLVIECFIALPYLPRGVFTQVQWSSYFPHII